MDAEDRPRVRPTREAHSSQEQAMSDEVKEQVQWAAWGLLTVGFIVFAIGAAMTSVL
jgi:hypothetical protein